MKQFLTILMVLISTQAFCQSNGNPLKDSLQEGVIYHFDTRKHGCGQLYYIETQNDTITVDKLLNLELDAKELPVEVYLTILGDGRCGTKTLSYIKRK